MQARSFERHCLCGESLIGRCESFAMRRTILDWDREHVGIGHGPTDAETARAARGRAAQVQEDRRVAGGCR